MITLFPCSISLIFYIFFFLPSLSFFLLSHYIPSHLLSTVFFVTSTTSVHWSCFCSLFWCYLTVNTQSCHLPQPPTLSISSSVGTLQPHEPGPVVTHFCQLTLHFQSLQHIYHVLSFARNNREKSSQYWLYFLITSVFPGRVMMAGEFLQGWLLCYPLPDF